MVQPGLRRQPAPEPWASVDWKADPDWDWHSADEDTPEQLRALWTTTIATSDRILARGAGPPRAASSRCRGVPSARDPSRHYNLRWILVHMIEEYARHNGHADLIRESIDGQVGD